MAGGVIFLTSNGRKGICYGKFGIRDNPETFFTIMTESDSLIFVQDNLENPARFGII